MRSTFTGLNTMVKGIFANQLSLDTVGHNITNASTEGYSRQTVNLAAAMCQMQPTVNGEQAVGTGVESLSILRARNVYADKQYRMEVATQTYNEIMQSNYEKIETTFYDSDGTGIQVSMHEFWQALQDLSTNASDNDARNAVIGKANLMTNFIHKAKDELVDQMTLLNEELSMRVDNVNRLTDEIVTLNKKVAALEANGSSANDLRDQRDLACDQLAEYLDITVVERSSGYYSVVADGVTLVNATSKLNLEVARGANQGNFINDVNYGTPSYGVIIHETGTVFNPKNGSLRGIFDAVDENKEMINNLAEISAILLTTFNAQHQAGYDMNGNEGENFFGNSGLIYSNYDYSHFRYDKSDLEPSYKYVYAGDKLLTGVDIIEELAVNSKISAYGGTQYIAAKTNKDGTGLDSSSTRLGDNAVLLSNFFDMNRGYTELTSEPIRDLYYSYYDDKGDTIEYFYDRITTTVDGNGTETTDDDTTTTKELVYRGYDGMVYKVYKKDAINESTEYFDSKGNKVEMKEIEFGDGQTTVYFTGNKALTTMNVDGTYTTTYKTITYNLSADGIPIHDLSGDGKGFLVYSKNTGKIDKKTGEPIYEQIYKHIDMEGEPTYTDKYGNTVNRTKEEEMDALKVDEEGKPRNTDLIAHYYNADNETITYNVRSNGESIRATGDISIYNYYDYSVSQLGLRAETMDLKVESQDQLIVQIENWRSSEAGVDWNEELTNMIKFQKGYGACARCLTTMDEMLDRLVNNTGQVGR